jgi:predicted PurR-regulated permease PerM
MERPHLSVSGNADRRADAAAPAERPGAAARERVPIFIAIAVIALVLYWIKSILLPFLFAGIIGFLAAPLLKWLARRTRLPRTLFASLLFLLILLVIAGAGAFIVPQAFHAVADLVSNAQKTIEAMVREVIGDQPRRMFGTTLDAAGIAHAAVDALRAPLSQAAGMTSAAEWGLAGIFGVFLTLVLTFYCLVAGPRIASDILWLVPPLHRRSAKRIWKRLDPVLRRYFGGVLVVVIYATIAAYLGLGLILGIKHALLLACLTGLLEMIPVVGPVSSAVIAGLVAVRYATGIGSIVAYAIYATALRISIDELVGPVVLGRAAHVHPVLVIFCFLAGGVLFGIVGVIMAMPVALAIKHILAELYNEAP